MIPTPLKRVKDFEELGFGMFIHWGLYSQLGIGEWAMYLRQIPKNEYIKLLNTFTAEDFNAEELVITAKEAGAKYIVLTARHHEGFSLYDTCGLNQYDAPHSPAKRDLIKEYVDACHKHEIKPFFYHTTLDWYCDLYKTDFDAYLDYLNQSIEILCTKYGEIGGFWFDGNWDKPDADWKVEELYGVIRKYQPDAIIVNNTGLSARGATGNIEIDSVTFEQGTPTPMNREGMSKYLAAEMCQTINDHWGFGQCDFNYKSTAELIETLCACRKVGANYLLNIGPTAQGGIDSLQKYTLKSVGNFIRMYEDIIRYAKPCGVQGIDKDFGLSLNNHIYLFVHHLKIDGNANVTLHGQDGLIKTFSGIHQKVKSIQWLDNEETLHFSQIQEDGILTLKATCFPYGVNTVVRVAKVEFED